MGIITTVYLKMSTIKTQCNAINTWLSSCLSVSLPFSILYKSGYVSVHVMRMCICSLSPIAISEIDAFSQNKMVFHVKSVQRRAKSYVAPSSLPFSILYKSGYVSVHVKCMCICSLSPITISEIDAFSQSKMVFHVKSVQRRAKSYVAPSCSIIM